MGDDRFAIQDNQYDFPYHYLPHFLDNDSISLGRELGWGAEYLSYMKYMAEKVFETRPTSILDVGCGDGRFYGIYRAYDANCSYKGIDLSEKAIMFAKALNTGGVFEIQNVCDEKQTYDCIVCIETLEHIPDDQLTAFISGISKALKKGGKLFVTVPSIVRPTHKKHFRHYSAEMLQKEIMDANCGLRLTQLKYIVPEQTKLDRLLYKYWNIFRLKSLLKIMWRRLWRNGLEESEKNGVKIQAIFEKGE